MREIEFSTMFDITSSSGLGGGFFDDFAAQSQIRVNPLHMDWPDSWNQLVRFALSSQGPDVSEVGTTWLGGLYSMDALRPFTVGETALFGSEQHFPPGLWQACQGYQNKLMLAIPWTLDVRVVLYRRDWLQKAGISEAVAFIDSDHFAETLRSLKAAGHSMPLGLATAHSQTRLIHNMACWVWSAGGDLRSDDGRRMMLMEPKSRIGMQSYFALKEFIAPETYGLSDGQTADDFFAGKTVVAILKENDYIKYARLNTHPEVLANTGLAMLMQTPYIGGSALAIWRSSMNDQDSLSLIQMLNSMYAWRVLNKEPVPYTPARLDLLAQSPLADTPFFPALQKSLQNGRGFQSGFRWSAVESRLGMVIQQLWDDLQADPDLDIAREVEKRFLAACSRLDQTILVS